MRRHRTYSGLIHIEVKNDPKGEYPDWPQAARDMLAADKANFVVMMIGLNDRRPIREKPPAKTSDTAVRPRPRRLRRFPPTRMGEKKDGERDNATNEAQPAEPRAARPRASAWSPE